MNLLPGVVVVHVINLLFPYTANIYAHVMESADRKNADILADVFLKKLEFSKRVELKLNYFFSSQIEYLVKVAKAAVFVKKTAAFLIAEAGLEPTASGL